MDVPVPLKLGTKRTVRVRVRRFSSGITARTLALCSLPSSRVRRTSVSGRRPPMRSNGTSASTSRAASESMCTMAMPVCT